MKSTLKLDVHSLMPGHNVIEIWHEGKLIGQVCGAEGPGVRVISKYPLAIDLDAPGVLNVAEVHVETGGAPWGGITE